MKRDGLAPVTSGVLVAAALLLSGCDNPYVKQLKDEFGWTESRMLKDGWLESRRIPSEPVYCYETLGDNDCFVKPEANQRDRLVTDRQPPAVAPDF